MIVRGRRNKRGKKRPEELSYRQSLRACKGVKRGSVTRKVVALTFDDGPNGRYTDEILEILQLNGIRATFFFIGKNIADQQALVSKTYLQGHVIGNHSYSHSYLAGLPIDKIVDELKDTSSLVRSIVRRYPVLFRPPYGSCSPRSRDIVEGLGFKTIMWSAITDDYNPNTTAEKIAREIINSVTPGAIIALHDGGGRRGKTVEALPIIIAALQAQGFEFLTIISKPKDPVEMVSISVDAS